MLPSKVGIMEGKEGDDGPSLSRKFKESQH